VCKAVFGFFKTIKIVCGTIEEKENEVKQTIITKVFFHLKNANCKKQKFDTLRVDRERKKL
jgi:hypothetical protein